MTYADVTFSWAEICLNDSDSNQVSPPIRLQNVYKTKFAVNLPENAQIRKKYHTDIDVNI